MHGIILKTQNITASLTGKKQQYINWLTKNGISFNEKSPRADLWMSVKRHREVSHQSDRRNCKEFWPTNHQTDTISLRIESHRVGVGYFENYVGAENADLKIETVEKLFRDKRG